MYALVVMNASIGCAFVVMVVVMVVLSSALAVPDLVAGTASGAIASGVEECARSAWTFAWTDTAASAAGVPFLLPRGTGLAARDSRAVPMDYPASMEGATLLDSVASGVEECARSALTFAWMDTAASMAGVPFPLSRGPGLAA